MIPREGLRRVIRMNAREVGGKKEPNPDVVQEFCEEKRH